jgi:single-stranded DNA-binding protein
MNNVFISGLLKGDPVKVKNDAIVRKVVVEDSKQNKREFSLFVLPGDNLEKVASAPSGKRIILEGRISSEEFEKDSGIYQGVISLKRVISLVDSMYGTDMTYGVIGGVATCEALRYTGSGSAIANLNIKNTRTFFSKKDNKEVSATTYLNAVAWNDRATNLDIPMSEVPIVASGILVPSEYESTKHNGAKISKIEVWVDDITVAGSAQPEQKAAPQAKPKVSRKTKGSDDDIDF